MAPSIGANLNSRQNGDTGAYFACRRFLPSGVCIEERFRGGSDAADNWIFLVLPFLMSWSRRCDEKLKVLQFCSETHQGLSFANSTQHYGSLSLCSALHHSSLQYRLIVTLLCHFTTEFGPGGDYGCSYATSLKRCI